MERRHTKRWCFGDSFWSLVFLLVPELNGQFRLKSSGWFKQETRKGNHFFVRPWDRPCDLSRQIWHRTIWRLTTRCLFSSKNGKEQSNWIIYHPGSKVQSTKDSLEMQGLFRKGFWSGKNLPSVKLEKSGVPRCFFPKSRNSASQMALEDLRY